MGSQVGVIGAGNLGEQVLFAQKAGALTSLVTPVAKSASFASEAIDRTGFNSLLGLFNVGAVVAAGNFTAKLQESDTTTDGDFTDVSASTQAGWGAVATTAGAIATSGTDVVLKSDLRACKKYVRWYFTLVSGTSVVFGAAGLLGAADFLPATKNS